MLRWLSPHRFCGCFCCNRHRFEQRYVPTRLTIVVVISIRYCEDDASRSLTSACPPDERMSSSLSFHVFLRSQGSTAEKKQCKCISLCVCISWLISLFSPPMNITFPPNTSHSLHVRLCWVFKLDNTRQFNDPYNFLRCLHLLFFVWLSLEIFLR